MDIVCFQESKGDIKVPNFKCFNASRTSSKGGGVAIAVNYQISKGIERINHHLSPDTIAIKLKKSFFKLNRDIILINTYIPPSNSSYVKGLDYDPFENLANEITIHSLQGDVILCVDLNSRIGTSNELLLDDDRQFIPIPSEVDYISLPSRNNKDKKQC